MSSRSASLRRWSGGISRDPAISDPFIEAFEECLSLIIPMIERFVWDRAPFHVSEAEYAYVGYILRFLSYGSRPCLPPALATLFIQLLDE